MGGALAIYGLFIGVSLATAHTADESRVVLSDAEHAWLAAHAEQLPLFFSPDFPPVEYAADDGSFTGLASEVTAMVEERLGITFHRSRVEDWNDHLNALRNGSCAVAPAIVQTEEREGYVYFTRPYMRSPVVMIGAPDVGTDMTLDDLDGLLVAVVSGFATEEYLRERAEGRFQIVPMPDVPYGLRAASFGQVDVFVENLAVAAYYIEDQGIPNLRLVGTTEFEFALSIGVSREYPLLCSAVGKALDSIPEAELEQVRRRWINLEVGGGLSRQAERMLLLLVAFIVLLALGLGAITYLLKRRLAEKVDTLKTAQQKLLSQAELLQLSTEATQAGIWDYRPKPGTRYLSGQWFDMLGLDPEGREVSQETFEELVHPEDLPELKRCLGDYLASGGDGWLQVELRLQQADGSWCWTLSKGKAVAFDEAGNPTRLIGLDLNIQQLRESQEMIAQSESRFRAIFDHAPYAIVINELDGGALVDANQAFLAGRGTGDQVIHEFEAREASLMSPREFDAVAAELRKNGAVKDYETEVRRADGTLDSIVFSSVVLDIDGRNQVLTMVVDVTERKRTEEALRASGGKLRSIFESMTDLIVVVDESGLFVEVAPTGASLLGLPPADLPGTSIDQVLSVDKAPAFRAALERTLAAGKPASLDFETGRGEDVRWFTSTMSRLSRNRAIWVIRDVSERKRAEADRHGLQEQLAQSQKLEAVGILAGGVAHDFNNMLGAIIGHAEMASAGLDDARLREHLNGILEVSRRSASLTRQLLAFASKQPVVPAIIDVNEAVDSLLEVLRPLLGENIELVWQPSGEACAVHMDPTQLDQVVTNLCVNARDAVEDIGRVGISSEIVRLDAGECRYHGDCDPGEYVVVTVTDSGRGMDRETLDRIFEPFYTTKALGRGTGLGMATVYGVTRQNGGFVDIRSEAGTGTMVRVHLPRRSESPAPSDRAPSSAIPRGCGEPILVVEDDAALRDLCRTMLERFGYTPVVAATPGEAIRLAEGGDTEFHMVLTDVIMPDMNGRELGERLAVLQPGIRQLYMSGYTADVIDQQGVVDGRVNFIQKPFSSRDLAVKIRAVLD